MSDTDSDETAGRRLYRAIADKIARQQIALARRGVKLLAIGALCKDGVPLGSKRVPWLLKEAEPKADGGWFITHTIEVER